MCISTGFYFYDLMISQFLFLINGFNWLFFSKIKFPSFIKFIWINSLTFGQHEINFKMILEKN